MSGIDSAVRTVTDHANLTTTNLAASATYTGPTKDGGADPEVWPTRVRPVVRHSTSTKIGFGYLVLEESLDGTTFVETKRTPIPADGEHRSFDWPLHFRYHRFKFVNGAVAQNGMRVAYTTYRGEGSSVDEDKVLSYLLSATNLAAGATFTSPTIDLGPNSARNAVRALARSDQASAAAGFRVEWSDDGTTWSADAATAVQAPAGVGSSALIESKAIARYARVVYVNGATAQTAFRLLSALVSL